MNSIKLPNFGGLKLLTSAAAALALAGCGGQKAEDTTKVAVQDTATTTTTTTTVKVPAATAAPQKGKTTTTVKKTMVAQSSSQSPVPEPEKEAPKIEIPPDKDPALDRPVSANKPIAEAKKPVAKPVASKAALVVQGQIIAVSKVAPSTGADDKDALTYIKYKVLSVEKGSYNKPQILAVHWGMKDKKMMPAASYKVGQKVRLELDLYSSHPELDAYTANDDIGEMELDPYWAG